MLPPLLLLSQGPLAPLCRHCPVTMRRNSGTTARWPVPSSRGQTVSGTRSVTGTKEHQHSGLRRGSEQASVGGVEGEQLPQVPIRPFFTRARKEREKAKAPRREHGRGTRGRDSEPHGERGGRAKQRMAEHQKLPFGRGVTPLAGFSVCRNVPLRRSAIGKF